MTFPLLLDKKGAGVDDDAGAGAAAPAPLFQDTFTDANSTAITAHTPDIDSVGGGWSEITPGKFDIQNNQLNVKAVQGGAACYANVGTADVNIVATIDTVATGTCAAGIVFRFTDLNNHWFARWLISSDVLQLYERNAGTYFLRDSEALAGDPGDAYDIEITANGTSISVTVNGVTVSYTSSFNQAVTNIGVDPGGATNDIGTRIDNLSVVNP